MLYKLMSVLLLAVFSLGAVAETVTPADIQEQVLPVDSDADGVIDDVDQCYKTAAGVKVDVRGCPEVSLDVKKITLKINFEYDSSVVRPEYYSEVEQVAVFMRDNDTTRVVIEGHADSDGSAVYNKRLSSARAQSVAKVLVEKFGIAAKRVTAVGFGEDRPLVKNDSAANKAKNRRVVALVKTVKEKRG